jgi:hypothetical protein
MLKTWVAVLGGVVGIAVGFFVGRASAPDDAVSTRASAIPVACQDARVAVAEYVATAIPPLAIRPALAKVDEAHAFGLRQDSRRAWLLLGKKVTNVAWNYPESTLGEWLDRAKGLRPPTTLMERCLATLSGTH